MVAFYSPRHLVGLAAMSPGRPSRHLRSRGTGHARHAPAERRCGADPRGCDPAAVATIPGAWPHDALGREAGRERLSQPGREHASRARFADGGNSVKAGILDIIEHMQTGRFKVFRHLSDCFEEFRLYRTARVYLDRFQQQTFGTKASEVARSFGRLLDHSAAPSGAASVVSSSFSLPMQDRSTGRPPPGGGPQPSRHHR